ncbi:hypothetical protein H5410_011169 [Solanum commersonii]|uniref:Uncharacterized protein n=1 Tax=Solanum commersonii TaxID=4109 RepID=A0A9J6APE9_SOLCO|nr:hypothetical protein H5410_011169 [Solanum commersonii]
MAYTLYTTCVYSWKTQTRHTFQLSIQIILSISFKSLQNLGVLSKSSRKAAVGVFKLPLKTLWMASLYFYDLTSAIDHSVQRHADEFDEVMIKLGKEVVLLLLSVVEGFDTEAAKKSLKIYLLKYAKPNSAIGFPGAFELVCQCKKTGLKVAGAFSADQIKVDANLAAAGPETPEQKSLEFINQQISEERPRCSNKRKEFISDVCQVGM